MRSQRKFYLQNFEIKEKKVQYREQNLKSIYLHNLMDLFLNNFVNYNNDKLTLYSQYMKKIYGARYNYYLEYLQHKGFIYLYKNYSVGRHSKIYAITDNVKKHIDNIDTKIMEMSNHEYKKMTSFDIEDNPINKQIVSSLYKVKINYDKSLNWIEEHNLDYRKRLLNETNISKIFTKDIYYNYDRYGRLHTNFTNLKKDIRNTCLTINGNELKELDIKNSQPFFLYVLMKQMGYSKFDGFDKDVLEGKVYDDLIEFSGEDIARDEMKRNVYTVIFGRNRMTKWNKIFQKKYPSVFEWIVNFKKEHKNYKSLSHKLQYLESNFMFNMFIPKVLKVVPELNFITIHDSIMFEQQYYNTIKPIFNNTLESLLN